ncbi:MAG: hypothetical protein Q9195_004941 [Heterodermia aff. obscurata]
MEKAEAAEGSHPEAHQTPPEGSSTIVTSEGSNAELKVKADPKITVDAPVRSATATLATPGSASRFRRAGAPIRNAKEAIATPQSASKAPMVGTPQSASKAPTAGDLVTIPAEPVPGSASRVPQAGAPIKSATEAIATPVSASKAPMAAGLVRESTPGGLVRSGAEKFASPGSASKPQKSVKHLECAYFFGSREGCKWTEENCSNNIFGKTEPPVAGKNAQSSHPEYTKWRNSSFEQGVPEKTPESAKKGTRSTTFSLPIRRQLDHISAKAQAQHLQAQQFQANQRPLNQSPTPGTGKGKWNIHAAPFTSACQKYDDPGKPGLPMPSLVGPPGIAPPVNHPANAQNRSPMGGPVNSAMNQNPYYGARPPPSFNQGGYYLAPPPANPGHFDYEAALHHCQYQLDMAYEENARYKAEIDTLRTELMTKKIELEASASGDQRVRAALQAAIDAYLTLDFNSEAVVMKMRNMCNDRVHEGMEFVGELNELALSLPSGRTRTIISKARDGLIAINRALLDGMDNGLRHHEECRRLRDWFLEQLANSGDTSSYEQYERGRIISGYKWKQFLK